MSGAIKSIMEGKMGINRVASPQGLYLSASEEDELFQHLLTCAKIGYPKTKCQAIGIVWQAVHADAAKNFTGKSLWNRFCYS